MAFTREMAGQFRLELNYEQIFPEGASRVPVPVIRVLEAQVERGRLAVEALAAVEVQAAVSDHLTPVDIDELPQSLVLKTSNPLLMAFRYAHADPAFELVLAVTRHREVSVRVADIEDARYQTLVTRDGLAVTAARLQVRNSRRQFLRFELPAEAEVWSAFVAGQPERPARSVDDPNTVLVPLINSANGFAVELVYAMPLAPLGATGVVEVGLPEPDLVVTRTQWALYLPRAFRYFPPVSNLEVTGPFGGMGPVQRELAAAQAQLGRPLRIDVPTEGRGLFFAKLYAGQALEPPFVRVRYVDPTLAGLAWGSALVGGILAALGLWGALFGASAARRLGGLVGLGVGSGLLAGPVGLLQVSPWPAAAVAAAVVGLLVVQALARRLAQVWQRRTVAAVS
ncbi:MAG: hypothetical protein ACFCBW_16140 [Candidatus Competibacterales bacterium]